MGEWKNYWLREQRTPNLTCVFAPEAKAASQQVTAMSGFVVGGHPNGAGGTNRKAFLAPLILGLYTGYPYQHWYASAELTLTVAPQKREV